MDRRLALLDATVPLMAWGVVVGAGFFHASEDIRVAGVVLTTVACAALAARRSAPWLVVAVTAAIAVALFGIDPAIAPYALLVPAAAFALAAEVLDDHRPAVLASLQHVGILALPILAADLHRTNRSYRDVVHERLALLGLLDTRPEHAREALAVIEDASRDAIAELRTILGVLRDPAGGAASLAPGPGVDEVADLVELARGAGLRARLHVTGERPDRLPYRAGHG